MKRLLLPMVIALTIPACDRQQAERMDLALVELKAAQTDSKRMADEIKGLTAGQEKMRDELATTLAALDEVKTRAAADLAAALAKIAEQEKKSGQQLDELRKIVADVKASASKSAETAVAQPAKQKEELPATPGGEKSAVKNGADKTSKTASSPEGRKPIKIDFGGGEGPKTNPLPGKADVPPKKKSAPSSGDVKSGSYKFIEKIPRSDAGNLKPGAVDSR